MKRAALLCVVALVILASAWAAAQAIIARKVDPPILVSSPNVGFRVEAWQGDTAIGRLMVRIDGEWVEADFAGGPRRLSQ